MVGKGMQNLKQWEKDSGVLSIRVIDGEEEKAYTEVVDSFYSPCSAQPCLALNKHTHDLPSLGFRVEIFSELCSSHLRALAAW